MSIKDTALIMVGHQNDYFAKDSILRGVAEGPGRVDSVLAGTVDLLTRLRNTDITIVSTPIVLKPDYRALASRIGILNAIKESVAFAVEASGNSVNREINSADAVFALQTVEIDLAFARLQGELGKDISTRPLSQNRLAVAVPAAHALAKAKRMRLRQLADEAFVMFAR
jgi:nicotinamidase-related amidase